MNCELCGREIVDGYESNHHLIPKANGGSHEPTAVLHSVCHKQIHALFTNKELSMFYDTINKLKAHRDVKRFVKWVGKKPINFDSKTKIRKKNR
jgi:5-methylcytosine-specific restriction endonuclease McrA